MGWVVCFSLPCIAALEGVWCAERGVPPERGGIFFALSLKDGLCNAAFLRPEPILLAKASSSSNC